MHFIFEDEREDETAFTESSNSEQTSESKIS